MRARFRIGTVLAAAALAGATALVPGTAFAGIVVPGAPTASQSTLNLVNVSIPGPVQGSATCVTLVPGCVTAPAPGIANLTVTASAVLNTAEMPVITLTADPGCAGQVSVGAIVTPGLASGVVSITVTYDLAGPDGTALPDSQTTIIKSVPFSPGAAPVAVTECATVM
jgi:hypothetical protein